MDYAVRADMDGQLSVLLVHLQRTIMPFFAGRQTGRQLTAELYNDKQLNPQGGYKMGRCYYLTRQKNKTLRKLCELDDRFIFLRTRSCLRKCVSSMLRIAF
jgi:hypothetical protein